MTLRTRIALGAAAVGCLVSVVGCGSDSTSLSATTLVGATVPGATTFAASTVAPADTTATSQPTGPTGDTTASVSDTTPLPTTTADPRPFNTADEAVALAATLHAEDYPAPWTQYAPGQPFSASADGCSYQPDGAITKVSNGGLLTGPTEQLGATGAYSSSGSLVFPDESTAVDYIALINSDTWATCQVGKLQQVQTNAGSNNVVTLKTRDEPTLNQNGFESYAEFDVSAPDGTTSRFVLFSFYRISRTVIVTVLDYAGLSDADFTKFHSDAYAALVAAYARVNTF